MLTIKKPAETLTVKETAERLKRWDNFLILTHIRPDGDTVGCAAALCAGLRAIGKTAYLLPNPGLTDNTKPYFEPYTVLGNFTRSKKFAPGKPEIFTLGKADSSKPGKLETFKAEKIVSVDIATENLFPDNAKAFKGKVDLAIDHHPSFEQFAKENIVRPEAAACGELLYDILSELGPLTPEIALPLYVAVSTDCGCFAYGNTTPHTHAVAAALMNTGIDYKAVNKTFFRTKTKIRMRLEAEMLREAEFYDNGRIVVMKIPLSMARELSATESDMEDLSALGPQIEGVDCAVTMRELKTDVWKFSLRTGERVNASQVCGLLGGGGHAAAAGCTVHGTPEQTRAKMLEAIARVSGTEIDT